MDIKKNLRIVWAITAKDFADAIKNKVVQGILIGVGFMMLSSQALSLLVGLKDEPTAYFFDQGKSEIIKDIGRARTLNFHPQDEYVDFQNAVSQSPEPVIGILIPADFDEQVIEGNPLQLTAYRAHWTKPEVIKDVVAFFEENLSEKTSASINIDVHKDELYPSAEESGYPMLIALGVVIGVMSVGLILTPYLILEERESHTLDALMVSPARIVHLITGKSVVGLTYSLTVSLLILVFSWRWIVHWDVVLLAVFMGGFCAVSIGLLIGALIETSTTASMISGLLIAGLVLPPSIWPGLTHKISPFMQSLIEIIPSFAMYKIVRQSFTEIADYKVLWVNISLLLIWIIVISGLVSWRIRRRDN